MRNKGHILQQYQRAILSLMLSLFFLSACRQNVMEVPAPPAFEKEYSRDSITVIQQVDRVQITTAQTLHVTLEVRYAETLESVLPGLKEGDKCGEFTVQSSRRTEPVLSKEGEIAVAVMYILEPFLPGEYEIPPFNVEYGNKGEAESPRQTIQTDTVKVTVDSVLATEQNKADIKEITSPLELPPSLWRWLAPALGILALAVLIFGWLMWRKRAKTEQDAVVEPPHLVALRQLDALRSEHLLEQGDYKFFYFRVSDILRHYLEDGFGMHAPERTTEEFLAELEMGQTLAVSHQRLLRSFLKQCDLVKFAEHTPASSEAEQVFDTCRRFIEEMHVAQAQDAAEAPVVRS